MKLFQANSEFETWKRSESNQILLSENLLNSKTWKTFDDNDQCHFAIKSQSSNVDRGY